MQRGLDGEDTNSIAKEPRCVIAHDDALTHTLVVERGKAVDDLLLRALAADQLEQPHVTDRVEVVGDRKLGPE